MYMCCQFNSIREKVIVRREQARHASAVAIGCFPAYARSFPTTNKSTMGTLDFSASYILWILPGSS